MDVLVPSPSAGAGGPVAPVAVQDAQWHQDQRAALELGTEYAIRQARLTSARLVQDAEVGAGQAFLSQHDEQVAERRKGALQAARDKLKEAQNNRRNLRMAGFGPQVDDSQQALTMGEVAHPAST